ncbi:hypothetical protein FNB79_00290 [Formosa sediminum]|uniref:PAS domain-containing protein n=1 Tax=Formosa sediminum TaxID=2594004 RepID=A0A516GLT7_9FLAO|nr:PAS domain-containing protein [Formosa sediminum]QDO92489.1 hypothetical protein FNB79_00290 [Formosa sediminum]
MFKIKASKLPLDSIFNQDLVNCLPGIFYLYEVKNGTAFLKRWNDKHEIVTRWSKKEMLDADLISFIDDSSREYIEKCFIKLIETGSIKNVYGNILTKTGEVIPHVFEGYRFDIDDTIYFMGMGMDISDLVSARDQIKLLEFQKKKNEKELFSVALQGQKKEELLKKVLVKLEDIEENISNKTNANAIKSLTKEIKSHFHFQDNWDVFKKMFNEIHYDFFSLLKKKHPTLTKGELKYCAYLKIQMGTTEICNIMNISKEGLIKKRYRLKKKLGLPKHESIDLYLTIF